MFGRRKNTTTTSEKTRTHPKPLLRTLLNAIRFLIHLLSLYMLGLFIYEIVQISRSNTGITSTRNNREYLAILVLSGVSVVWSFISLLLTCFGHLKTGFLLALIDLIHVGAFIAVSILLKSEGFANCKALFPSGGARRDCNLLRAAFAFAIALAVLYFIATILSILLAMAFRKSRAYGPSPDNGYSASHNPAPRSKKHRDDVGYVAPVTTTAASHGAHHDRHNRHSAMTDNTQYTGNTVVMPGTGEYNEVKLNDPNTARGAGLGTAGMRPQTPVGGYEPYRKPVHERGVDTEAGYANSYDRSTGRF